jgi:hypothetical protein
VEAESCRVSVGKDKFAAISLIDTVDSVDDFEEQGGKLVRMGWWANAVINLGHESDMALICLIVTAIPA